MIRLSSFESSTSIQVISLMLAESHRVFREGLRALLEESDDIRVIGEADDGRKAIDLAEKLCPSVILMDMALPVISGLEATRQILRVHPSAKIIFLSLYNNDAHLDQAMALGAAGYLTKETSMASLLTGIREVSKGRLFFDRPPIRFGGIVRQPVFHESVSRKGAAPLSSRETEILQMIAESQGNKQIASELEISIKTVEKHRQNLMRKLNIHCAAGLTRFAIAAGIVERDSELIPA